MDKSKSWIGYTLVFCAVFGDAFFLDNQAYAKHKFKPTANQLLTSANLYTVLFCLMVASIRGTLFDEVLFCLDHPSVNIDIAILSILQAIGQVAIYFVITNFKQHIFPLIAMTRKVFTIVLSILLFKHKINLHQIASLAVVFGALSIELLDEFHSPSKQVLSTSK